MTLDRASIDVRPHNLAYGLGRALGCVLLVCALAMLLTVLAPGKAQAHAIHADVVAVDIAGSADAAGALLAGDTVECGTACCGMNCASVIPAEGDAHTQQIALIYRFALVAEDRAEEFTQYALRRPPRT